jgi:hypothetical protein
MGFFVFGKDHTGSLYGFLPSANIGQVVYWKVRYAYGRVRLPNNVQQLDFPNDEKREKI